MTEVFLEKGKVYSPLIAIELSDILPLAKYYKSCGENVILITHQKNLVDEPINHIPIDYKGNVDSLEISEWGTYFSSSKKVKEIFKQLKSHQGDITIRQKGNHNNFKPLYDKYDLCPLGLTPEQGDLINDKIYQYNLLKDSVSLPNFVVTNNKKALIDYEKIKTNDGAYSILARGWGGSGARYHPNKDSLSEALKNNKKAYQNDFILSGAINSVATPSMDVLIANENEIMPIVMVDQLMRGGIACYGVTYPSKIPDIIKKDCYEMAREVGKKLAKEGYKGWINIDFIIDDKGKAYFCEVNGRYSGATPARIMIMEKSRPSRAPSLAEMERKAVVEGTLGNYKLWEEPNNLCLAKWYMTPEVEKGTIQEVNIKQDPWEILSKNKGFVMVARPKPGTLFDKKIDRLGKFYAWSDNKIDIMKYIKKSEKVVSKMVKPFK